MPKAMCRLFNKALFGPSRLMTYSWDRSNLHGTLANRRPWHTFVIRCNTHYQKDARPPSSSSIIAQFYPKLGTQVKPHHQINRAETGFDDLKVVALVLKTRSIRVRVN